MDWQIKTSARKSVISEHVFVPGDSIVSLIYKESKSQEICRADLLESELSEYQQVGTLIGRWARVMRSPDEMTQNAQATLASAEEFFLSLFEHEPAEGDREMVHALMHILGLMLERKRVLRPIGVRQLAGEQLYRHVKSKRELSVPVVDISFELMTQLENTLGDIIL